MKKDIKIHSCFGSCAHLMSRIAIAPSMWVADKWFLFRDNGQEVSFLIKGGLIRKPSHHLFKEEIEYIVNYIIPRYGNEKKNS